MSLTHLFAVSSSGLTAYSHNVIDAIRASISIPGIFTPVPMDGRWLVDGGLTNPVPVNLARAMGAGFVIAVDVTGLPDDRPAQPADRPPNAPDPASVVPARHDDHPLLMHLRKRTGAARKRWLPDAWRDWWRQARDPSLFDVVGQSIRIMEARISAARLRSEPPDILLRPAVGNLTFMEFHRAPEAIAAGYAAAMEQMEAIRTLWR